MSACDIDYVQIVEDDADSAAFFVSVATQAFGAQRIEVATCLADARHALSGPPADLVLLDLYLPDGTGTEIIGAIRQRSPDTMIVIITVFDDDETLFGAVRAGVDGYLLKAETREQAVDKLLGILRDQPPLSARVARRILRHFEAHPPRPAEPALTAREQDALRLLARGHTIAAAATELGVSPHTVQHHVRNLYRKLGVHTRAAMTRVALDRGLL